MGDVAFKDLCLDANRPQLVAPFWADLLGLTAEPIEDSPDLRLRGATPELTVWVNTVEEPQEVKNRVHLDVRRTDAEPVPGAPVLLAPAGDNHWWVQADPDGLQFCAFPPRDGASPGPFELVVDSVDPLAIATWWAERTGATVHQREGAPWAWLEGVAGFPYAYWVFNPVPEPKTVKNRVHWDVTLVDADVEALVSAGASVVRAKDEDRFWTVMADPEGNEFCAFPS